MGPQAQGGLEWAHAGCTALAGEAASACLCCREEMQAYTTHTPAVVLPAVLCLCSCPLALQGGDWQKGGADRGMTVVVCLAHACAWRCWRGGLGGEHCESGKGGQVLR